MNFHGISNPSLDAKGRIAMPKKERDELVKHCNGEMVVTIDTRETCLLIYPKPEWEDVQRRTLALPSMHKKTSAFMRLLVGHATDIQLDASGRLQLTPPLRNYAGLEKRTTLVGQTNRFELWNESHWDACRASWLEESEIDEEDPPALLNSHL